MAHEATDQELDEDGLVVQKYYSRVLVVVPPEGFGDQILRYARSSLYNVHVGSVSAAAQPEEEVRGRLQDTFLVDEALADQDMERYSGLILAGGEGQNPLADDPKVHELLRVADRDKKLIATWGNGLAALARSGVVRGHKVSGDPALREEVGRAGGRYSGREITVSRHLITARDEGAGMRFGQALAEFVRI